MKNKKVIKSDITFSEACRILGKSERTLSRYIKKGLIIPEKIKSQKGSIEYRFNKADLEAFKIPGTDKKRPDIIDDTRQGTGQNRDVIILLKETTEVLKEQLKIKDEQLKSMSKKIDQLIERSRESNILIKGMANKLLLLENTNKDENREVKKEPTEVKADDTTRQVKRQDRGQKVKDFFKRLFKG
jgi:hypothetical protein